MKHRLLHLTLSIMALLLSACGKMNLSINKHDLLIPPIILPFSAPPAAEVVSGSVEDALTPLNHYHVNATAGTMIKDVQVSTTNHYMVSYGLDGEILGTH